MHSFTANICSRLL